MILIWRAMLNMHHTVATVSNSSKSNVSAVYSLFETNILKPTTVETNSAIHLIFI